ncbi:MULTISPECIES: NAD(P)-dependent oxidoreductase [unclassified Achromobacter]|uniref:NAD(P)-dependent oxidoreductase n=1 Tax=unclassified Achromobacter TaxID=2626865 RepID=UPI000B51B928|nr:MULTISPECIES: NAD(P)-dependent oxidoreductase [unclassified Achromobacter]OWT75501.1 hydroxyacid dehydrogenase [Achromobacter sp. HZ28]OWT76161.1 hydroxyacid dehydrogenase [Achromobacter sp. HZ34]
MQRQLLILIEIKQTNLTVFEEAGFQLHFAVTPAARAQLPAELAATIDAVVTNGSTGFEAHEMAAMPRLRIVCALGAGYEKIDVAAARARGIAVSNGRGANDNAVADHALALMLAAARGIVQNDQVARGGNWGASSRIERPTLHDKKLGILGLGTIGRQIARRAAGGFDMAVGYHNRRPVEDGGSMVYFDSPMALASWADFLVVATPGGAATHHLVDAAVLGALGPDGFLVNIARGSVVDTQALLAALHAGTIAGAALDVVEGEPDGMLPEVFRAPNLTFTPHIAGRSPEALAATVKLATANLLACFEGRPLVTPVDG